MCAQCNSLYSSVDGVTIDGSQEIKAVITLGAGNTIADMINSRDTQIPDNFQLYSGSDVNYIPHGLAGSARDLIIRAEDGLLLSGLALRYFDPVADTWVGPIAPRLFLTNGSLNWGCWRDFADVATPFKTVITLLGAFVEVEGDSTDKPVADDTLDPESDNPISNKAVTAALTEVTEHIDQVAVKLDTVVDKLKSNGVGYSVVELSMEDVK